MNDREALDAPDSHLSERMERAVGGLRAPDVLARAMARGRRQRTHRRLTHAAGGVAATTALVLTVSAFATDWPGPEQGPSGPSVAADPTAATPTSAALDADDACGGRETGWWTKSTAQIKADLSALLPQGTRIGETKTEDAGIWDGKLLTGGDADYASLTLLPPPGVLGPRRSLEEVSRLGPCGGGSNEPFQAVKPCDELTGNLDCEEIRSQDGTLVGVVTEQVAKGQLQPDDRTYFIAAVAGPGGGHVELNVGDAPTITIDVVREIVADPVWIG